MRKKGAKPRAPNAPRKDEFVREYLVDLNATQAAVRCGYSPKTARSQGARLLTDVDIKSEIQKAMDARAQRVEVSADTVLRELLRVATCDLSQAFDDVGALKPIHDIPEDVRRAIASIEVDELWEGKGDSRQQVGVVKKVKFWDKNRSLENLGRHLKLFHDSLQVPGLEKLAEAMRAAESRIAGT